MRLHVHNIRTNGIVWAGLRIRSSKVAAVILAIGLVNSSAPSIGYNIFFVIKRHLSFLLQVIIIYDKVIMQPHPQTICTVSRQLYTVDMFSTA